MLRFGGKLHTPLIICGIDDSSSRTILACISKESDIESFMTSKIPSACRGGKPMEQWLLSAGTIIVRDGYLPPAISLRRDACQKLVQRQTS